MTTQILGKILGHTSVKSTLSLINGNCVCKVPHKMRFHNLAYGAVFISGLDRPRLEGNGLAQEAAEQKAE